MGEKLLTEKELNEVSGGGMPGVKFYEGVWVESPGLPRAKPRPWEENFEYAYQVTQVAGKTLTVQQYKSSDKSKGDIYEVDASHCELVEQPWWF